MSDDTGFEEENNEGEGIASLRKQYAAEKKARAELEQRLATFEKKERQSSVAEILKARGVPPSAAKFYTDEDASEDAVGKWLEANADVFHVPTNQADPNAAAAARVTAASFGSEQSVQSGSDRVMGDPEEIMRLIKTQPYEELVKLGYMPKENPQQLYKR